MTRYSSDKYWIVLSSYSGELGVVLTYNIDFPIGLILNTKVNWYRMCMEKGTTHLHAFCGRFK